MAKKMGHRRDPMLLTLNLILRKTHCKYKNIICNLQVSIRLFNFF